jgi:hypothetical protein
MPPTIHQVKGGFARAAARTLRRGLMAGRDGWEVTTAGAVSVKGVAAGNGLAVAIFLGASRFLSFAS